jgi:hypothetical protein
MKVLLFKDEEYKGGPIFKNYNISKNLKVFM